MSVYWDVWLGLQGFAKDGVTYSRDAQTDVYNNNRKYQATGEATLWGKVKPITYGKRRIMGQLLQIGNQRMEESHKQVLTGASTGGGRTATGGFAMTYIATEGRITGQAYVSTFAYCFGEPGNPTSRQRLTKIWIDQKLAYDVTQGMLATNFSFHFYDGNENQLPDGELNRDRYDFPVGYRGLMYIVFYNFTLPHNPNGNPLIEAEFVEELTNTQTITNYDNSVGSGTTFLPKGSMYDPKKDKLYVVGEDNLIYRYNCTTKELEDKYPITGYTISGTSGFTFVGAGSNCLVMFRLGPTVYFLCTMTIANTAQLFLVDADTGITAASYGTNSGNLDPGPGEVLYATNANVVNTTDGYSMNAYVLVTDLFDNAYKFLIGGNQFQLIDIKAGLTSTNGGAIASDKEGIVSYVMDGKKIGKWAGDGYQDSWYTGLYNIVYLYAMERDKSLVIVESDGDGWRIRKIIRETQQVIWSFDATTHPDVFVPLGNVEPWKSQSYTAKQRIGWVLSGTSDVYILDMIAGQLITVEKTATGNWDSAIYDAYNNKFIGVITTLGAANVRDFNVYDMSTGSITLESLIRDLCRRLGYDNADVTVQGISDLIVGAAFTEITNVDEVFTNLSVAYNFEVVKRGKKIKFIRRGYGDIFDPDLISTDNNRAFVSESDDEFVTIKSERAPITRSAGTIQLVYIDPAYDYTAIEYRYSRNDSQSDPSVTTTIQLPIIMSGSQAATLASRVLLDASVGRMEHEIRLPAKYLALEKGDVIELVTAQFTDFIRVNEISYNADWSMSLRTEAILTSSATPVTVADPVLPPEPPPMLAGDGEALIFDTPLLRYTDQFGANRLEVYLGLIPASRQVVTTGTILKYYETEGPFLAGNTTNILTYGSMRSVLPPGPVMQINYLDTIQFRMIQGDGNDFQTDTVLNMLAGSNRVLIGRPGRWEMIGFVEASFDSTTRLVTLTSIVRGLRGTDYAAGLHEASDLVVLCSVGTSIILDSDAPDMLDKPVTYAAVRPTGEVNQEDSVAFYAEGSTRKPWRPYNVHVVNDAGDLDISWQRRTRLNGPLLNGTGAVPLDEATESYDLVIYRGGDIVRTVAGLTSPTFTYTTSMQSTDGWPGAITQLQLDVYQNSALVGRGFPMSGEFHVE